MDKIVLKPILDYGAKLMNDKIIVKKVISNNEFIVFVEDLRMNLVLKQIPNDEDLTRWIKIPPHTNIVSIFDTFEHKDGDKQYKFSLTELSNNGDMYKYIQSLNLKLDITIPLSYMEVIYDCMIQLTLAMEFAHNNGLCHGNFSLSNVALSKDGDTTIYKIKNFAPGSSINLPMTDKWPFTRGRKNFKEAEKIEILMLKDIYSLGICLLELMIGRFSSKKFSISLDSLPLTWAEY
jgi:serine/threonine protein kinase